MTQSIQTIVDFDVTQRAGAQLAEETRCWLVDRRIIAGRPSACVPGGRGYAPGPQAGSVCEAGAVEAGGGVEFIVTARGVFDSGSLPVRLRCGGGPGGTRGAWAAGGCGAEFTPGEAYFAAVEAWRAGDDQARYACPHCARETRLVAWEGPTAWAFGRVALRAWGWAPFKPSFVKEVGAFWGHRTKLVAGLASSGLAIGPAADVGGGGS